MMHDRVRWGLVLVLLVMPVGCGEGTRHSAAPKASNGSGGVGNAPNSTNSLVGQAGTGASLAGSGGISNNAAQSGQAMFATINPNCVSAIASGDSPLIDDFEDGDRLPIAVEGRDGHWWGSGDGSVGATFGFEIAEAPSERAPSLRALHMVGTGHLKWGANTGLMLRDGALDANGIVTGCPYDASIYRGIAFWAKGTGELLHVKATTMETAPVSAGGICAVADESSCWNDYSDAVTLKSEWQRYSVAFDDMSQDPAWGISVDFDPKHLHSLRFQTDPAADFDYWLDDVSFYQ